MSNLKQPSIQPDIAFRGSPGGAHKLTAAKTIPDFRMGGLVDRAPMSAEWNNGYLSADPELLERADALIVAKASFGVGPSDVVSAALDGPRAAALTLMHCFDRITRLDIVDEDLERECRLQISPAEALEVLRQDAG
jgi:hypothetical protein